VNEVDVKEAERVAAVARLFKLLKTDPDFPMMCAVVCKAWAQPDIGHLARFCPDAFDELYEEIVALVGES